MYRTNGYEKQLDSTTTLIPMAETPEVTDLGVQAAQNRLVNASNAGKRVTSPTIVRTMAHRAAAVVEDEDVGERGLCQLGEEGAEVEEGRRSGVVVVSLLPTFDSSLSSNYSSHVYCKPSSLCP